MPSELEWTEETWNPISLSRLVDIHDENVDRILKGGVRGCRSMQALSPRGALSLVNTIIGTVCLNTLDFPEEERGRIQTLAFAG